MDKMINYLQQALDGASARQKAISNNIANVNTPGYKRKDVDFTSILKENLDQNQKNQKIKLQQTDKNHLAGRTKSVALLTNFRNRTKYKNDKNNVDIDVEMAELAKNQIYYNTVAQQLNNKLQMLKNVIDKGGR